MYLTRKHKAPKAEVILACIVVVFALINYLPKLLGSGNSLADRGYIVDAEPNTDPIPVLDENGNQVVDDNGNPVFEQPAIPENVEGEIIDDEVDDFDDGGNWLKDIGREFGVHV